MDTLELRRQSMSGEHGVNVNVNGRERTISSMSLNCLNTPWLDNVGGDMVKRICKFLSHEDASAACVRSVRVRVEE